MINQHRRCAFGGSYGTGDAWGSKGLGPVGEGVEQVNESCGVTLE